MCVVSVRARRPSSVTSTISHGGIQACVCVCAGVDEESVCMGIKQNDVCLCECVAVQVYRTEFHAERVHVVDHLMLLMCVWLSDVNAVR